MTGQVFFGGDQGGTTTGLMAVDAEGAPLLKQPHKVATEAAKGAEHMLQNVVRGIREVQQIAGIGQRPIGRVCMAIPGQASYADCRYIKPVNLKGPGFEGFAFGSRLSQELSGVPVIGLNDANACAVAEMAFGAAKGLKDVAFITIGTGIGGGVVIDGKLLVGSDEAAGEFGHIPIDFSEHAPECGCGGRGCLEAFAGNNSLIAYLVSQSAARGMEAINSLLFQIDDPDQRLREVPPRLYGYASAGDLAAQSAVQRTTDALGRAAAGIINAINPEVFVFGGGNIHPGKKLEIDDLDLLGLISRAAEKYLHASIRPRIGKRLFRYAEINESAAYGAADYARTAG